MNNKFPHAQIDDINKIDNKFVKFTTSNPEDEFYIKLYNEFLQKLPNSFRLLNHTIPFPMVRLLLSVYRYDKYQIRNITKAWLRLGLCELIQFRGVKLKLWFNGYRQFQSSKIRFTG